MMIKCFFIHILVAIWIQGMPTESPLEPIELEEVLSAKFNPRSWDGSWMTDNAFTHKSASGDILKYDLLSGSNEILLEASMLEKYPNCEVTISPDQSYALIRYNGTVIFRHSSPAQFAVVDIAEKKFYDLADRAPLQLVKFAPKGHSLVYVLDNNIYYLENISIMDVQNPITVTTEGRKGEVYCGVTDWLYEEEVIFSGSAIWFSPEATHVAYAVFDDEQVKNFPYIIYGTPGSLENQYPTVMQKKYPKVGTPNPIVTVLVYDIAAGGNVEFQLPPSISNKHPNDYILYDLTWISDQEVAMISTNRVQNQSVTVRCFINGACYEESSYKEENGWLEPKIPIYSRDGGRKLEILPREEGNDYFDHIVLTDITAGFNMRLTYGRRVVLSIQKWDESRGLIYFTSTVADEPAQQHVNVVDENGNEECLSCDMIIEGTYCTYAQARFGESNPYFVISCMGPKPSYHVIRNSLNFSEQRVWEDNASLRKKLANKSSPIIRNLRVPINENFTARVRLFLPPHLNENCFKQYPTIVSTYGGPNSNQISDYFGITLQHYLTTKKGYIYILIDGRGSGRDGQNKMFQMYKNFGTVEVDDQIAVTKYLQNNFPYIDPSRTGITGWSYGGFVSSWVLARDTDRVFKFAIAIAPLTNLIYYDTIYTERYMGLLEDNEIGYNNTDLSRVVDNFKERNYFIIHSNADDNVHYQNSMILVKALEGAGVIFTQQSYPDEDHALSGVTEHLYRTVDRYVESQFSTR